MGEIPDEVMDSLDVLVEFVNDFDEVKQSGVLVRANLVRVSIPDLNIKINKEFQTGEHLQAFEAVKEEVEERIETIRSRNNRCVALALWKEPIDFCK